MNQQQQATTQQKESAAINLIARGALLANHRNVFTKEQSEIIFRSIKTFTGGIKLINKFRSEVINAQEAKKDAEEVKDVISDRTTKIRFASEDEVRRPSIR